MLFTGLCAGDTGVGVVDVASMGVAADPIFKPLGGEGGAWDMPGVG